MDDIFPRLTTDRLILRCLEPGDAADISRLITSEVSRWVANWPCPFTVEMAEERIRINRARAIAGKGLSCAVVRKEDGQFMGYISIFATDPGRAALGYWLGEEFHGHGYMREAAPVALRAGFEILDVKVIEAGAQLANTASFAVMRACGMRPVGERITFATSRQKEELCAFFEATAP
jgi:[ribosomal protein S5]-alanine N-acetyltransferase